MIKITKCHRCIFWNPDKLHTGGVTYGECHRFPPTAMGWPVTSEDGFCGEGIDPETAESLDNPMQILEMVETNFLAGENDADVSSQST